MKAGGLVSDDLILRLISNEFFKRGWLKGQGPPQLMTLSSTSTAGPESLDGSPAQDVVDSIFKSPLQPDEAHLLPEASDSPSASFILDGFPRTAAQAEMLDKIIPINLVVSITTPFDVILERISGRWVHEPSGRVYNTTFNAPRSPGIDDVTGEPLVQRPDDSEEVYRARFAKFEETSRPLLDHYARKGILWEASGLSSDEITPKVFQQFEKMFC